MAFSITTLPGYVATNMDAAALINLNEVTVNADGTATVTANSRDSILDNNTGDVTADIASFTFTALPAGTILNLAGFPLATGFIDVTERSPNGTILNNGNPIVSKIIAFGNNGAIVQFTSAVLVPATATKPPIIVGTPSGSTDLFIGGVSLSQYDANGNPTSVNPISPNYVSPFPIIVGNVGTVATPEPSMALVMGFVMLAFVAARSLRRSF